MWLIDTHERAPEYFQSCPQDYAILSCSWHKPAPKEHVAGTLLTEQELEYGYRRLDSYGWKIVFAACDIAKARGIDWIWVDTCGTDQDGVELETAMNARYAWYRNSKECYAFIREANLPASRNGPTESPDVGFQELNRSAWLKDVWTLAALLAPDSLRFYGGTGPNFIGTRQDLSEHISQVTGISQEYLRSTDEHLRVSVRCASVAQRMSWASTRFTTKSEHYAYSLLGIFDVKMRPSWGEGDDAFMRLQKKIIARSRDDSIFAWGIGERDQLSGMLARSPRDFESSGAVINGPNPGRARSQADWLQVNYSSETSTWASIAAFLFRSHPITRDTVRLRCFQRHGKTQSALWLSLKRHEDGLCYRAGLASRSINRVSVVSNALQRFGKYSTSVTVSVFSYADLDTTEYEEAKPTPRLRWVSLALLWRIVFTLRLVAIAVVIWVGLFGQFSCSDGTDKCDLGIPTLVTLLAFFLRDLFLTRSQFWAVVSLWLLVSGSFSIGVKTGNKIDLAFQRPLR
ncbi:hypothetical protein LTR56_006531 [Elasticomyces elasticus]|nr:hypothetical protein LTR22_022044 [Elasticomyces elasticus]KAK3649944.1 hypothetical protein LTR56_006531 [Elasticomyces elasticus]KAK4931698.1 hypothetical protein LTR49_001763 [Elasticomyces elasticus]KAK5741262.1 hypothetical protein LTS12_024664 [Elasticomyces elasticus]